MNTSPDISFTSINSFDFKEKIQQVKKDNKDNLVEVDKQTGNVTIYTFDQNIPSDFKKGINPNHIVFEDSGNDDANSSVQEINKFTMEVKKAGTIYEPSQEISMVKGKIQNFRYELDDKVNQMNIRRNISSQLDNLSNSLDSKNIENMEKWSKVLTNTVKQFALNNFYVPDFGFMHLDQPQMQMAANLREITFITDNIIKRMKE